PSYSSAVIPAGASAWTVRSAAVLPDPRLVLPEMSRIRTSAIRSTYPEGYRARIEYAGRPCHAGRPGGRSAPGAGAAARRGARRLGTGPGHLADQRLRPERVRNATT